jgi:hypothetical protein
MLPFGVTIPATVPQGSEIPEGLMNNPVHGKHFLKLARFVVENYSATVKLYYNFFYNTDETSFLTQNNTKILETYTFHKGKQ